MLSIVNNHEKLNLTRRAFPQRYSGLQDDAGGAGDAGDQLEGVEILRQRSLS